MNLKRPRWLPVFQRSSAPQGDSCVGGDCLGSPLATSAVFPRAHGFRRWHLAALAALLSCTGAEARAPQILDPQALRFQITDTYLGMRIEAEHEETTFAGSSTTSKYDRLFVAPIIGLNAFGSIYHPNLLSFTLNGEFSPGYTTEESTYTLSTKRKEYRELGNYYANLIFLGEKPYRSSIFLSQNYTYRDYDFFNRVNVNITNYGANLGYQTGPVPFTFKVWQREEDSLGTTSNSWLKETGAILDARNTRESGETTFNYTVTSHNRREYNSQANGTENSFGIADRETLGSHDQMQLSTSASYSTRRYTDSPTDEFNALANLTVEHSPTLSSFYDLTCNHSTTDYSTTSSLSSNYHGGISLRHQLYESLTSTLRIQGQDFSSTGSYDDSSGKKVVSGAETQRFGIGITESYTKRLGTIGRFTLVGSLLLEHTVQSNTGDTLIQTDENHAFSSKNDSAGTDSFFLNLPYVDQSSIVVTDTHHSMPAYQANKDYTISQNGSLTMIRRTPLSMIPDNSTVLVSYHAKSSPSGTYGTATGLMNMRIDLWNGLAACYYRMSSVQNSVASNLILQDMNLYSVGLESNWRWLRTGVEYESNASTFSSYNDVRFFQSLSFKPDTMSSLNFDFLESRMHYVDADRDEENYSLTARYQRAFNRNLSIHFDAGVAVRRGIEVDQTLEMLRPSVEWNFGRLTTKLSYSFYYGKYELSDKQMKQTLYISAQRSF